MLCFYTRFISLAFTTVVGSKCFYPYWSSPSLTSSMELLALAKSDLLLPQTASFISKPSSTTSAKKAKTKPQLQKLSADNKAVKKGMLQVDPGGEVAGDNHSNNDVLLLEDIVALFTQPNTTSAFNLKTSTASATRLRSN